MTRYKYAEAYVYALVDPRSDETFYIGKTVQQTGRYYSHLTDRLGAPYPRMQEIKTSGHEAEMRIVATFPTEYEALEYEHHLIEATPNILNRTKGRIWYGTPPLKFLPPQLFWDATELTYVPCDEFDMPEPEPCYP